jgi:hypothetical protein
MRRKRSQNKIGGGPVTEKIKRDFAKINETFAEIEGSVQELERTEPQSLAPRPPRAVSAKEEYDCARCDARVWEKGYGGQCKSKKIGDGCFCKMHQKKADANDGEWFLGMVTEERPEDPVNPGSKSGKSLVWKTSADREVIPKPEKKETHRGVSPLDGIFEYLSENYSRGITPLDLEDDKLLPKERAAIRASALAARCGFEDIVFEEVEYRLYPDGQVRNDFSIEVGKWDPESKTIEFVDEDMEEEHNANKEE